ncbi:MAG: hypothetical protein Q8P67_24525, partial [archaeon]|nr:hypothetical protein [archaeon]
REREREREKEERGEKKENKKERSKSKSKSKSQSQKLDVTFVMRSFFCSRISSNRKKENILAIISLNNDSSSSEPKYLSSQPVCIIFAPASITTNTQQGRASALLRKRHSGGRTFGVGRQWEWVESF